MEDLTKNGVTSSTLLWPKWLPPVVFRTTFVEESKEAITAIEIQRAVEHDNIRQPQMRHNDNNDDVAKENREAIKFYLAEKFPPRQSHYL